MIENLVVQIICGNEAGTAFYVAPNLILTAFHTVSSFEEVGVHIIKDETDGDMTFTPNRSLGFLCVVRQREIL